MRIWVGRIIRGSTAFSPKCFVCDVLVRVASRRPPSACDAPVFFGGQGMTNNVMRRLRKFVESASFRVYVSKFCRTLALLASVVSFNKRVSLSGPLDSQSCCDVGNFRHLTLAGFSRSLNMYTGGN
jgi:hypothetical protein